MHNFFARGCTPTDRSDRTTEWQTNKRTWSLAWHPPWRR